MNTCKSCLPNYPECNPGTITGCDQAIHNMMVYDNWLDGKVDVHPCEDSSLVRTVGYEL